MIPKSGQRNLLSGLAFTAEAVKNTAVSDKVN